MENIDKQFEEWVRKRHLKGCPQCRAEGKAKLVDTDYVAVALFTEFYKQK